MEEEVENLHKNETRKLVKLSKEKRVISCKWLFKVKDGIPGVRCNQYKARYVVCGFDQRKGIDFNEVFSLVVRHTSIRVLLSIVSLQDLELEQHGVKIAFLPGHLEEEIYVEQPEGNSVDYSNLRAFGCPVYVYVNEGKPVPRAVKCIFLGYGSEVKGYHVWCPDPKYRKIIHSRDITFNENVLTNSGKDFVPPHNEDKEDMSRVPYSSAVGSLMYAMVCTRPDLAHVVSVVSRYIHNLGKMHWEAVKCIIRYLKGTSNIGLSFEKGRASSNGVKGYVDSYYAGDLDARKSFSSYIFSHCGSAISWYSSLLAITALSTIKA
nr:retrovirus-related Pol polyprotein from transposon TNT 1-94 [Tanacetum cinerariifolium]